MKMKLLVGVLAGSLALCGSALASGGGAGSGTLGALLGTNPSPGTRVDSCIAGTTYTANSNGTFTATVRNSCSYRVVFTIADRCSTVTQNLNGNSQTSFLLGSIAQCGQVTQQTAVVAP